MEDNPGFPPFFRRRYPSDEESKLRSEHYPHPVSCCRDVAVAEPGGFVFPARFPALAEKIFDMEVRPDDVWIVSYPRCGTTWTQVRVRQHPARPYPLGAWSSWLERVYATSIKGN